MIVFPEPLRTSVVGLDVVYCSDYDCVFPDLGEEIDQFKHCGTKEAVPETP